ncbi:putative bifunctional diguanylate cyclase/phosphodiesterase [Paractinoplanes atraurantiacus]|uniref:putative bifunctional diguanylate cyclase/phosphodiesterase n=1 Tax=Paractinoplanes atraurantiacus TaxID=1036182 RepID=UPI000BE3AF9A|nr:bifunctional diguanylate cyclase/phosphodiesterase [Actinoplanes atraurantiacus]
MSRERVWCWWLAAGVLAIIGQYVLPVDGLAASLVYDAIGLVSGLVVLVAVRLHRPARPAMWYWFAAGQLTFVLGDLTYGYYQFALEQSPYPSLADVFYLASYPMLVAGLLLLVRGSRGNLIDAAVVAIGLGLVYWVFVIYPAVVGDADSAVERFTSTAYPAADVLLLALLARLLTGSRIASPSVWMLAAAVTLMFAADTGFALLTDTHPADPAFLLSYVVWAAAALHPSMARAYTAAETPGVGRGRLLLFGACSLLSPALLFVPTVRDDQHDLISVAVADGVLFLLVLARMAGFVKQLDRAALTDDLTGLASRRRVVQALRDASRPQLALLGLNGFKNVNDELGRPVGDRVLSALGARLLSGAPAGAVVARIGGDEFAVLLPHATADEVRTLAMALSSALRHPVTAGGHELYVGVAIGLAGGTGVDAEELLRQAEAAMYAAKHTGDPVRRWTPALDERAGENARLGGEIRMALDSGQFRVVYQPIVELPSGRVAAVEALVRWEHPLRGMVSPADFIPVAERNGLIVELGEWILRMACHRMAGWRATLGPLAPDRVSVNVSARQLARHGFAATVAAVLAETGLPAPCLAVEMTETAVFEGGQAVVTLNELRALGVRIALDDFGTGHSSLNLLQTVPVDILKVDKSFVDNITEAGRSTVIAEALIQVSRGLGLAAVAEGVETAAQAEALQRLGYSLLQGYYFGRPVADPNFALSTAVAEVRR